MIWYGLTKGHKSMKSNSDWSAPIGYESDIAHHMPNKMLYCNWFLDF